MAAARDASGWESALRRTEAHRSEVIDTIKARLSVHLTCRVVATQCIEAGVDLDFEAMYRALAPLEAIIQAAGRCNRNGTLPGGGTVMVFIPEDEHEIYPGKAYRNAAETVKLMCASAPLGIHDPETIAEYCRRLLRREKDKAPCPITGRPTIPTATVPPISGLSVVGGHAQGDALICFDKDAFCSYGLKQAANAPVSEEAFAGVKAALDELLKGAPVLAGMKFVQLCA